VPPNHSLLTRVILSGAQPYRAEPTLCLVCACTVPKQFLQLLHFFKKTRSGTNDLFPTESLLNHPSRRGEEVALLHDHTEARS